ncbi:MAG: rod shape-determining protein MreC [Flavobacteriaceae bacterium]|nr:rod shape-determining protein MreC [Flavobacteriaceae bacterium]|tara:strand:+ start:23954 stop:24754 length:801 start_codon:yes stop_codon:yes gene_type:complete
MQRIIYFLIRNKNFILFLSLLIFSISLNINYNEYNKSKFINSSNFIFSSLYETQYTISKYFNLEYQNKLLVAENTELKEIVYNHLRKDSIPEKFKNIGFGVTASSVIKNSYSKSNNFITINKGFRDSIKLDNGVVSSNGVVGVIDKTTSNFSRIISILNTNLLLNAKFKNSNHFGVLSWDGLNINIVQLKDVPKQAKVKIGDTVVTGGNSLIFPKDILIGYVDSFKLDGSENYLELDIKLSVDMTNIENLYIIDNNNISEINKLNE